MGNPNIGNRPGEVTPDTPCDEQRSLRTLDWLVLPLLSIGTICLLLACSDLLARWMFADRYGSGEDCIVFTDPSTGTRGIPHCSCKEKIYEGEVTDYWFNNCGYRTAIECGPRQSGTYRIVMVGTSMVMGMRVPREETFAALLPTELSAQTGKSVELYNEGMPWRPPHTVATHFNEVLAAKPDLILWAVTPADISEPVLPQIHPEPPQALSTNANAKRILRDLVDRAESEISARTFLMLRHFLYQSQSLTVSSFLARKPDEPFMKRIHGPEFLKTSPGQEWQSHLAEIDNDAATFAAQARAAGVPLVTVLVPIRAQAAMISMGKWPAGYDPYKLDYELRKIVQSHGGIYISILPYYRSIANPEQGYYPVDGHPNPEGHALIASLLARELTSGALPALKAKSQLRLEQGKGDRR